MNRDVVLTATHILNNLDGLFSKMAKTQYWMLIVNNNFDHEYDWFLNSKKKGLQERSHPLYVVKRYDLSYLEQIVEYVQKANFITIYYRNFGKEVWPVSQKTIQKGGVR